MLDINQLGIGTMDGIDEWLDTNYGKVYMFNKEYLPSEVLKDKVTIRENIFKEVSNGIENMKSYDGAVKDIIEIFDTWLDDEYDEMTFVGAVFTPSAILKDEYLTIYFKLLSLFILKSNEYFGV